MNDDTATIATTTTSGGDYSSRGSTSDQSPYDPQHLELQDLEIDVKCPFRQSIPGTMNIEQPKSREASKQMKFAEYSREGSSKSLTSRSRNRTLNRTSQVGQPESAKEQEEGDSQLRGNESGNGGANQIHVGNVGTSGVEGEGKWKGKHDDQKSSSPLSSPLRGGDPRPKIQQQKSDRSTTSTLKSSNTIARKASSPPPYKFSSFLSMNSTSGGNQHKSFLHQHSHCCFRWKQSFTDPRDEYFFSLETFNYTKRRVYIFFLLFSIGTFFCLFLDYLITVWITTEVAFRTEHICEDFILDSDTIAYSIQEHPLRILAIALTFVMAVVYNSCYPFKTEDVVYRATARSSFDRYFGVFERHQAGLCICFVALGIILGFNLAESQNQIDGFTNALVMLLYFSSAAHFCPLTFGFLLIYCSVTALAAIVGTGVWLIQYYHNLVHSEESLSDAFDPGHSETLDEERVHEIEDILWKLFFLVIAIFFVTFGGLLKSVWEWEKARRMSFASRREIERERVAKEVAQSETNNLRGQVFQLTLKLNDLADFDEDIIDFETSYDKAVRYLQDVMQKEGLTTNGYNSLQTVVKILTTAKSSGVSGLYEPAFLKNVQTLQNQEGKDIFSNDQELQQWLQDTLMEPEDFVDKRGSEDQEENHTSWQSLFGQLNKKRHAAAIEIGPVPSSDQDAFKDLLQNHLNDWPFDIFRLRKLTRGRPLYSVGFALFYRYDLIKKFKIDETKLHNFLTAIEDGYLDNPYHNSMHGADVAQSCHFFLANTQIHQFLSDTEKLAIVVAALIHDFEHPGLTNKYLIATEDVLSTRYNDKHVLENHHIAAASLILQRPNCAILENVSAADKKEIRSTIIHCVIATDLASHFEHIGNFKRRMTLGDTFDIGDREDRLNILTMALKCADLGHAAKPREIHHRWTRLVMEEFYRQGDKERRRGMPISAFMDRSKPQVAKSQTGFIDYLVKPLWECWVTWLDSEAIYNSCFRTLLDNQEEWKQKSLEETDPDFRTDNDSRSPTPSPTAASHSIHDSISLSERQRNQISHAKNKSDLSPLYEEQKGREPPSTVAITPSISTPHTSPLQEDSGGKSRHRRERVSFQDEVESRKTSSSLNLRDRQGEGGNSS